MKIGRIERLSPEGPRPRTVVVNPAAEVVVDVQRAEQERLLAAGDSPEAALRKARAIIPDSLSEGLGSASFKADLARAMESEPPADAVISFADATWLPALDPPRFRDFMAFERHHVEARRVLGRPVPPVTYELPTYYKGNPLTLVADGATVDWPGYSQWIDFELELGLVLGGGGVDLGPEEAGRLVFGVTLLNDLSARDRQFHEASGNLGPAKGKDFATAVGPWITTVDELDLRAIPMSASVNGERWALGSSGEMMWSVGEIVAYLSTAEPLIPGELIGTGTMGGGCGLELERKLAPGDVVEIEAEGIGLLRTKIGPSRPLRWEPPARTPGRTIADVTPDRS